jgi:hypothetical protein
MRSNSPGSRDDLEFITTVLTDEPSAIFVGFQFESGVRARHIAFRLVRSPRELVVHAAILPAELSERMSTGVTFAVPFLGVAARPKPRGPTFLI